MNTFLPVHILTLRQRVELLAPSDFVEAGDYLLDDENAAQLMIFARGGEMIPPQSKNLECYARVHAPSESPEVQSVLFMRAGGFGDLVLLTPVLREHKRRWPDKKIGVSCFPPYAAVLEGLPYVDEVLPYPLPMLAAKNYDRWVFLEHAIECNPEAEKKHATDILAGIAKLPMEGANMQPDYIVKPSEAVWAQATYPRTEKRRVCIQVGASALNRRYPLAMVGAMAGMFLERGWEVYLLGAMGELPPQTKTPPGLVNLTAAGLTFRQSCAVLNACDVAVAPDSAMTHVAGALNVPCVSLYGAFEWQMRTKYSPSVFAIQGSAGCPAPCYHHVNQARQDHFPKHCPTQAQRHCALMADIKPERVVAKAEQVGRRVVA